MRWLVIDSSCNTGHQRTPGVLAPDALQPFLRRCRLLGQFDDVANRIIIDIGIDGLHRPAIAAVENGLSSHHGDAWRHLTADTGSALREPLGPWPGTSPACRPGASDGRRDCRIGPSGSHLLGLDLDSERGCRVPVLPTIDAGGGVRWDPSPPNASARHRQQLQHSSPTIARRPRA